jgi:hypothetical protein
MPGDLVAAAPSCGCRAATGFKRRISRRDNGVADAPDTIILKRDRDLVGRANEIWIRRALFGLLCLIPLLALLNVFGQRPQTSRAVAGAAALKVYAPERVRSGVLFQARFRVTAREELKKAMLVLDPGWLESMTLNTIEPAPVNEASDNSRLTLELGHIPRGESHLLFLQFQVNPTNAGRRSQDVDLFDGDRHLLHIDRTVTVYP